MFKTRSNLSLLKEASNTIGALISRIALLEGTLDSRNRNIEAQAKQIEALQAENDRQLKKIDAATAKLIGEAK